MRTDHGVIMQYFEWYLPENCGLWKQLKADAPNLAKKGITALWLPPAYKGYLGAKEVGYAVYDLFDLGEFDQKGSVATKYGTKQEYLDAIKACHEAGISVYADIVLNHKVEGDAFENLIVTEYDPNDRNIVINENRKIRSKSKFTFPGRNGKYNDFTWDHTCFSGSDRDERSHTAGIFGFKGAKWSADVDDENGNYDYLLGLDINFNNPAVVAHLLDWGEWYVKTTGIDGFRLDALKHIDINFFPAWLKELRTKFKKELFTVGEYWKGDVNKLKDYIDRTEGCLSLFDVPLHYAFHNISESCGMYDLSQILSGTLTAIDSMHSVTFVDNHDTQPGQMLQSSVQEWFLPHAYAIILLREEGYPCIFYGDYYGLEAREGRSYQHIIDPMLEARHERMYGLRHDYFDNCDVIGWTYEGDDAHKHSGLAVLLSDKDGAERSMYVGAHHAGEVWEDGTGACEPVTIDEGGNGVFHCAPGSMSFYRLKTNR
ncbi:MAG: alpha-amylase [Solobacterium sp.]|nr:alpha-amylase [Solobacterium sp.]